MKPVLNGTDYMPSTLMELSRSFLREFQEASEPLFLCGKIKLVFECFSSLSSVKSLTHKISFHGDLDFGRRQDTKQADHAGQKPLSGVNYPFYNTDI